MEEGGQAERSTRGGLRGPRGPRGEKLEKGRFKYQPPRGGPRARCLYLASFFFSRTDASPACALSFSGAPALPPSYHPLPFFAYAHTLRDPHRKICTQTDTLTHTSIDPRPEKRRLRAVQRWRTVRQCYVLIGRSLPTLLFFADRANFLHIMIARAYMSVCADIPNAYRIVCAPIAPASLPARINARMSRGWSIFRQIRFV